VDGDAPKRLPVTAELHRKRRVRRPTRFGGANEETQSEQDASRDQQPEGKGVQPREGHIFRAKLQRNDIVAQASKHRDDPRKDHDRRVHREDRIVGRPIRQEILRRGQKLPAEEHRQPAADDKHRDREGHILDADDLVIDAPAEIFAQLGPRGRSRAGHRDRYTRHTNLPFRSRRNPAPTTTLE
jgi:hypothetical protein